MNTLNDLIASGALDENIDLLANAVKARQREVKARNGLRVTIQNTRIKPAYLAGCSGVVNGIDDRGRVRFTPDPGTRALQRGENWRINLSSLEFESQERIKEAMTTGKVSRV